MRDILLLARGSTNVARAFYKMFYWVLTIYLHYLPLGISVGICPWNFPIFVVTRKVTAVLLSGCTVVVKSSELTPFTVFKDMSYISAVIDAGKCDLLLV